MFTKPQAPYVPTLVYEFYEAYDKPIPKNKNRVKWMLKPLNAVEVWGVQAYDGRLRSMISWDVYIGIKMT